MLQKDALAYRRHAPHTASTQGSSLSSGFKSFGDRVSECDALRFEIQFYSHEGDTTCSLDISSPLRHPPTRVRYDQCKKTDVVHKDKRLNVS